MWSKISGNLIERRIEMQEDSRSTRLFFGVFIFMVLLLIVLRTFVFSSVWVKGSSMNDTLDSGDLLVVNKLAVPKHGDVIVFYAGKIDEDGNINYVLDEKGNKTFYIKRVIADEKDVVYWQDGVVSVKYFGNEEKTTLTENYIRGKTYSMGFVGDNEQGIEVNDGFWFVMGDNRFLSNDSRGTIGQVDKRLLLGVVPQNVIDYKDTFWAYFYRIF